MRRSRTTILIFALLVYTGMIAALAGCTKEAAPKPEAGEVYYTGPMQKKGG